MTESKPKRIGFFLAFDARLREFRWRLPVLFDALSSGAGHQMDFPAACGSLQRHGPDDLENAAVTISREFTQIGGLSRRLLVS